MKYLDIASGWKNLSMEDHNDFVRVYIHNLDVDLAYRHCKQMRDWLNEWILAAEKQKENESKQ